MTGGPPPPIHLGDDPQAPGIDGNYKKITKYIDIQ